MDNQDYLHILKRVGWVLLAVGLIDISVMIYCIVNNIKYSSSFNIFAVIAGFLLLRGSLGTASLVRWFSVFMLAASVTGLIAWPFFQPFDLTFTQIRLYPGAFVTTAAVFALLLGILYWLVRELGREPIQAAITNSGRKLRDMRIPAAIGVGLIIVVGIFTIRFLGGESAERAKSMAERQVGPGYHFFLSSIQFSKNNQGTSGSGVVTAWNDSEIKKIPVHWEDR